MLTADRGPRLIKIQMPKLGPTDIWANVRVSRALAEVTADMSLYHGVRLNQVVEAAYEQGRKDGRREVFDAYDAATLAVRRQPELRHTNPGRRRRKRTTDIAD